MEWYVLFMTLQGWSRKSLLRCQRERDGLVSGLICYIVLYNRKRQIQVKTSLKRYIQHAVKTCIGILFIFLFKHIFIMYKTNSKD